MEDVAKSKERAEFAVQGSSQTQLDRHRAQPSGIGLISVMLKTVLQISLLFTLGMHVNVT